VPSHESGRRVAVVGSGPAGLAAAAQLRGAGHAVTVYERADAIGGLLRYGIPAFKLEKAVLDRRLEAMVDAGITFVTSSTIGPAGTPLGVLQERADAVLLAVGSTTPRLIPVPGSDLEGVMPAMTYLEASNRAVATQTTSPIDAHGRAVLILGGGDTGADCLGTAHRQGARSVTQIEILERPPDHRPADQPWPTMPRVFKVTSAHDEGGERVFATETVEFLGETAVTAAVLTHRDTGQSETIEADLVLIAAGFTGPELATLGISDASLVTERATLRVDDAWRTPLNGEAPVFACGDAVRGQSLIVWAIAEGRSAAAAVDAHLMGETALPAPVAPYRTSW